MKPNFCENCNSEVVKVKKGDKVVGECSYCGHSTDMGYLVIEDFLEDDYEE